MKIPPNIKAIIFDYDGVLGDSTPFNTYACKQAASLCGIDLEDDVYLKCAPGGATIQDIATCIVTHYGKSHMVEEYLKYKKSFDKDYVKEVTIYDGVIDAVQYLSKYYTLAVNTGTRHILVDSFIDKYDLKKYFQFVVAAEDIERGKPDPESYLLACSKLNLSPSECLVIEDGVSGIASSKRAGCYVVGLATAHDRKILLDAGCDVVVNQLSEIMVPTSA